MENYITYRLSLKNTDTKTEPKKRQPIAKRSKKRIKEQPVYVKFVIEYLSRPENAYCTIRSPVCTHLTECINHRKRRFKDTVMNEKYIQPSCVLCNLYIEQNDAWARQEGHLLSKFS